MVNRMPPLDATTEGAHAQSQSSTEKRGSPAGARKRHVGWAFAVFALLLFDVVFVKGYEFGVGDHYFYLPELQAYIDSSLYPDHSTTIFRRTNKFSFFNPVFAIPARYLGVEWTFLVAYLVAVTGFYSICFLLAEKLTDDRRAAYGFLVLMLPVTFVSLTTAAMWDPRVAHRGLVIPLCLLGVYRILNRKHVSAYFLFGVAALIHAITAAAFAAACAGALIYDVWQRFITPREVLFAGAGMFAGAGLLLWKLLAVPDGDSTFFAHTTREWVAILHQRNPYMFPEFSFAWIWSWVPWFLLFLVAWLAKPDRRREDAVVMAIVIACGVLLIVSVVVASVIPFLPLARFEFARSFLIVILFARIYLAGLFWAGLTSRFVWARVGAAFGVVVVLSLWSELLSPFRVAATLCAVLAVLLFRQNVVWAKVTAAFGAVVTLSLWGELRSPRRVGAALCAVLVILLLQRVMPDKSRPVVAGGLLVFALALLRSDVLAILGFVPRLFSSRWLPDHGVALAFSLLVILTAIGAYKCGRLHSLLAAYTLLFCLANASYFSAIAVSRPISGIPEGWIVKAVHLPGLWPVTPWMQAQLWARTHTQKGAVFIAPWRDPNGFPIYSQRTTVADWESGSDGKFNYAVARRWLDEKRDLENFDEFSTADFCRLRQKYRFQYIVTKKKLQLQFPLLYENAEFSIYQLVDPACRQTTTDS